MSEMEGRLHALKEDLKNRVRTVNRLKREKARMSRERLKQKEELLHKHIEVRALKPIVIHPSFLLSSAMFSCKMRLP